MVIIQGNGNDDTRSSPWQGFLLSLCANTLGSSMYPTILPVAIGKLGDKLGFLTLERQPVWEKENSEFKPVKLPDFFTRPIRADGYVNMHI